MEAITDDLPSKKISKPKKQKGKGTKATMDKLEKEFGKQVDVSVIWQLFKGNNYDVTITVQQLNEKTGKKVDPAPFVTEKNQEDSPPADENDDEDKSSFRTSEEVYNRIKVRLRLDWLRMVVESAVW